MQGKKKTVADTKSKTNADLEAAKKKAEAVKKAEEKKTSDAAKK